MSISVMTSVWKLALDPAQKMLLLALADEANDDGYCFPSRKRLAEKCSVSTRTVTRQLSALKDSGLIDIEERSTKAGDRTSNGYTINLKTIAKIEEGGGDNLSPPLDTGVQGVWTPVSPPLDTGVTTMVTHELPLKSQPAVAAAPSDKIRHTDSGWFTAWWCYAFEVVTGKKYIWGRGGRGGGDSAIVVSLFRSASLLDIMERACGYMLLDDSSRWPQGPPSLFGFAQTINELAGSYSDSIIDRCIDIGLHPDFSEFDQDLITWQPWNQKKEDRAHG